jgi:hypothetical protein
MAGFSKGKWYSNGRGVVLCKPENGEWFGVADCRTVDVDADTAEANARLMSAAADLLAACKEALKANSVLCYDDAYAVAERMACRDLLVRAIAKAELVA